jgi:glycosyltransferase involved in cell wall biosynthesis
MKHNSLLDRIIVTGYVADEDLAVIYNGAQMLVYPSLYEGFGLPPEAMQCGVPVITSNTYSIPAVVGDAGIMVNPKDSDALCQAINDIYRKPALCKELATRLSERAKQFSWESCARQTV